MRLQFDGFDIEAADSVDQPQPGSDSPLGIVLMRSRIAEIDQHAVAHILSDKAVEATNRIGDAAVVGADQLAQILRVQKTRTTERQFMNFSRFPAVLAITGSAERKNLLQMRRFQTISEFSHSLGRNVSRARSSRPDRRTSP